MAAVVCYLHAYCNCWLGAIWPLKNGGSVTQRFSVENAAEPIVTPERRLIEGKLLITFVCKY